MAQIRLYWDREPRVAFAAVIDRRTLTRTVNCARKEIRKVFQRNLRAEIDKRTTRRTGTLRRTARIRTLRAGASVIALQANFPGTAYNTPRGRGRRGASKSGQYAFVVNHQARFIQAARNETLRSVQSIFRTCLAQALSIPTGVIDER